MKISLHSNTSFFVVTDFGKKVSDYVRFSIPPKDRKYDEGKWVVLLTHLPAVVAIGEKYSFVDYSALPYEMQLGLAQSKRIPIEKESNPFTVMHLLPTAPSAIVDAVYRALVKLHHPDVGGNEDTMRGIIDAYNRIKSVE